MKRILPTLLLILFTLTGYVSASHIHNNAVEGHQDNCVLCLQANNMHPVLPDDASALAVVFTVTVEDITIDDAILFPGNDITLPAPRAPPSV